jgi:hypothetical protein
VWEETQTLEARHINQIFGNGTMHFEVERVCRSSDAGHKEEQLQPEYSFIRRKSY